MTFGERLVKSRKEAGLQQKQLAEKIGITPTRLNYWEKDKRQPDVEMIKALSSTLGVATDYLIGRDTIEKEKTPTLVIEDERTIKFVDLFNQLTESEQDIFLAQMKGVLASR